MLCRKKIVRRRRRSIKVIVCAMILCALLMSVRTYLTDNLAGYFWRFPKTLSCINVDGDTTVDSAQPSTEAQSGNVRTATVDYESTGYMRAKSLYGEAGLCQMTGIVTQSKLTNRLCTAPLPAMVYCPLCKVASTFWTRVFMLLQVSESNERLYETPFDVPISEELQNKRICRPFHIAKQTLGGFRFLFVRSPYSLLFSTYVDKIMKPTPYYINLFGKPAVERLRGIRNLSGSDVTFAEFVDEVVYQYRKFKRADCHVATVSKCRPCQMNYTFVGKLETFKEDTMEIMSVMGLNTTIAIFKRNFSVLHADDAIDDVTSSVFTFSTELRGKYMHFSEAVKRIWRSLQIRGILDHVRFPLTDEEAEHISRADLVKVIQRARLSVKPEETKKLKHLAFVEAYRTLPARLMGEIRDIYKDDFRLFQYETMPAELYDKDQRMEVHGFLNLSNIHDDLQPRGAFV